MAYRPVELVGAEAVGGQIRSSNWKVGIGRLIVASCGGRTAPGRNGGLAGGLMLVVCRIRSHRFVEKRGHSLNLAPQPSGYGLGLELQVLQFPVFKTGQKNSLVVDSGHFVRFGCFWSRLNRLV